MNELADRIDGLLAAEREKAADLSHQLRTSLTVLRLDSERLESADDRSIIARDVDRLEEVVTRVIQESRATPRHEAAGMRQGTCDLGEVVRQRVAFWSILATDENRRCRVDVPERPHPVGVSQGELEVCIDALLNNVMAYTPGGTAFSVGLLPAHRAAAGP